ncbi:MAG: 16S rRNA processing protein RimM [Alphaproteobacteria bacterium]|nr:16S rRNA processing protein RimM [Alphaproteobacteria bacterium]
MDGLILVGVIVGAQGLKGRVKIKSFTQAPEQIGAYGPLFDRNGQQPLSLRVTGASGSLVVAAIEDCRTRNQAEALKGRELYIPAAALPQLEDDETYYWSELVGLKVVDAAGRELGSVAAVHNYGAGDMLEIAFADKESQFLPFTHAVFPQVNRRARTITLAESE